MYINNLCGYGIACATNPGKVVWKTSDFVVLSLNNKESLFILQNCLLIIGAVCKYGMGAV